MKKIIYILILLIIGCDVYETPSTYNFSVTAYYPEKFDSGGIITDTEILIRDIQTGREFTQKTNEKGTATFNIRGGNYDIIISFSEEHEIDFEGIPVKKTLLFNGSLNGEVILENGVQLEIETKYTILNEGFIIKELYTSGGRTPEGKAYGASKFVEIYNLIKYYIPTDFVLEWCTKQQLTNQLPGLMKMEICCHEFHFGVLLQLFRVREKNTRFNRASRV